jgi:hypothetical protein
VILYEKELQKEGDFAIIYYPEICPAFGKTKAEKRGFFSVKRKTGRKP